MPQTLKELLQEKLPENLIPGNVGGYNEVAWQYKYPVTFDYNIVLSGTDWQYELSRNFVERRQFQIDQEAGFLLTYIAVEGGSNVCNLREQPIMVNMVDVQSQRTFMVGQMPVSSFGDSRHPLVLERPHYLFPRSIVEITLSTLYDGAPIPRVVSNTAASPVQPRMQLIFSGYRIRQADVLQRNF